LIAEERYLELRRDGKEITNMLHRFIRIAFDSIAGNISNFLLFKLFI